MKIIFILIFYCCFCSPSFSGGNGVGNGGGAWSCDGEWIKLLDLFEAEYQYNLEQINFNENYKEMNDLQIVDQIFKTIKIILPDYINDFNVIYKKQFRIWNEIDTKNIELENIPDAQYTIKPNDKSCSTNIKYLQIANYTETGELLVNKLYFRSKLFNSEQKAALRIHELIYEFFRTNFGDLDSIRARKMVGLLFSKLSLAEMQQEILTLFQPYIEFHDIRHQLTTIKNTADLEDLKNKLELLKLKNKLMNIASTFYQNATSSSIKSPFTTNNEYHTSSTQSKNLNSINEWNKKTTLESRVNLKKIDDFINSKKMPINELVINKSWNCGSFREKISKNPEKIDEHYFSLQNLDAIYLNNLNFKKNIMNFQNNGSSDIKTYTIIDNVLLGEVQNKDLKLTSKIYKYSESILVGFFYFDHLENHSNTYYKNLLICTL